MTESYDNWFVAIRPLEDLTTETLVPPAALKYRADFPRIVKEIRGGVRLGRTDEVRVEVETSSPEDAAALAALGRWAPGVMQLRDPFAVESALAEIADNLTLTSAGNLASLSFTLDEGKLEQVVKERAQPAPALIKDVDGNP